MLSFLLAVIVSGSGTVADPIVYDTDLACYEDSCNVTVYDDALAICYTEDTVEPGEAVCSEFRRYVECPVDGYVPGEDCSRGIDAEAFGVTF